MLPTVQHEFVETNGIRLHVAQAGPVEGPLVILLHGFPEFWYGWRKQIDALAAAGLRVWAPDQRGYNLSDKPPSVQDYRIEPLAADVLGLIAAAGRERASIVGHDWGGVVTWWLAANHAERLDRAVILNVPHPAVMRRHLRTNPRQMFRSRYIVWFQLPGFAEWLFRRRDGALLARILQRTSRPGTFSEEDLARYRESWRQPGALTGMLNWYRAARHWLHSAPSRVSMPLLLLWGTRDRFLGRELAEPSLRLCDQGQLHFFEKATHWLQHEEAATVNARLITFLRGD